MRQSCFTLKTTPLSLFFHTLFELKLVISGTFRRQRCRRCKRHLRDPHMGLTASARSTFWWAAALLPCPPLEHASHGDPVTGRTPAGSQNTLCMGSWTRSLDWLISDECVRLQAFLGVTDPALEALTQGLWAAVHRSLAVSAAAAPGASGGVTLEDLTIAKVGYEGGIVSRATFPRWRCE